MNNKFKPQKIIINLLLPFFLFSCESAPKKLVGEKVSIFEERKEISQIQKNILLEKPYINEKWISTGGNSKNTIGHIGGKKSFKKLFSKNIGKVNSTQQILYSPVANKDIVYTISGNLRLTASDIKTGKTLWEKEKLKNNDLIKFGALALDDNYLYIITNNSQLLKLDAKTGEIIYSKYFNTTLKSGLQLCNNMLLFIDDSNELFAVNAQNGEKAFTHKSMEESSSFIKGSNPLCIDDKIIATFSNGEIHMIMQDTATPIWLSSIYKISPSNINNITDIVANPITNGNIVIVKGYNDITKAIDINEGMTLWENNNGGITTPTLSNDIMFDINNNKVLSATDIITGKIIWESKLPSTPKEIFFDPLLVNNQLIIPISNGEIIKFNPYTGRQISIDKLTNKIDTNPIVIEGYLIIISDGNLEIFS